MLLLDTHALFWWSVEQQQLSPKARDAIRDRRNEVYVSVASVWEIAIKVGPEKWPEARSLLQDLEYVLEAEQFHLLPISVAHVRSAGLMVSAHREPFDRLLAAQATIEGLTLVSSDARLATLGATVLW